MYYFWGSCRVPAVMENLKLLEFEIAFSRPGKVIENGKSVRSYGIILEFHIFVQNIDILPLFQTVGAFKLYYLSKHTDFSLFEMKLWDCKIGHGK